MQLTNRQLEQLYLTIPNEDSRIRPGEGFGSGRIVTQWFNLPFCYGRFDRHSESINGFVWRVLVFCPGVSMTGPGRAWAEGSDDDAAGGSSYLDYLGAFLILDDPIDYGRRLSLPGYLMTSSSRLLAQVILGRFDGPPKDIDAIKELDDELGPAVPI